VQERGAKIPAPIWEVEVVAPAAAPPPPCLSLVLQRVFDCESRCSAPKVLLSDTSYLVLLTCTLWHHKFLQSFWQHLLPCSLLLTPRKARTKTCLLEKHYAEAVMYLLNLSVYVALQSLDEDAHSQ